MRLRKRLHYIEYINNGSIFIQKNILQLKKS